MPVPLCSDIINSPKLADDLQRLGLGSLLPPRQVRLLESTFLSNKAVSPAPGSGQGGCRKGAEGRLRGRTRAGSLTGTSVQAGHGLRATPTCLSCPQASVRELMARALELESQRWAQDVAPQRLDGHCHSELAIDIFQVVPPAPCARVHCAEPTPITPVHTCSSTLKHHPFAPACSPHPCPSPGPGGPCSAQPSPLQIISQGQAKAESITLDLGMQTKHVLLVELAAFLRRWVCIHVYKGEDPCSHLCEPPLYPRWGSCVLRSLSLGVLSS